MNKRDLLLYPVVDDGYKSAFLRRLMSPDKNLLSNPGFETAGVGDPDFWANWVESEGGTSALAKETVLIHKGSNAVKMSSGNNQCSISQSITSIAAKKYILMFWTMSVTAGEARYSVYDNDHGAYIVSISETGVSGTTYTIVVKEFTTPVGCTSIDIKLWSKWSGNHVCYFDTCGLWLLN